MPVTQRVTGDLQVDGSIICNGIHMPELPRTGLAQDDYLPFAIDPQLFRVWDAFQTPLGTPGSDDLGIATGAFGTGLPYISTGDVKAAGTVTRYGRVLFMLPANFVAGQSVRVRLAAGMLTTLADTSAALDVEAYKTARDTTKTGSDLITTAPQSINSLTFEEKYFDLSPTGLVAGDVLDLRIKIETVDGATVTAVTAAIAHAEMLVDIKG